jgi:hypothetical protein
VSTFHFRKIEWFLNLPWAASINIIFKVKKRAFQLFFLLLTTIPAFCQMTSNDVATVMAQAITRASQISSNSVIAVVDREGFVLGVWSVNGTTPATADFTNLVGEAIARAGTASFLSSDQHAFSSRTALFIVQQNFLPGVKTNRRGRWWA